MWKITSRAPVLNASITLAFALQLRKRHGKTSVRVRKTSVRLRKTSVKGKTLVKDPYIFGIPNNVYKR
jgi:hypothetical protein